MTDNEKAAIAAGLWDRGPCFCHGKGEYRMRPEHRRKYGPVSHLSDAPNMHDPANLWRALERRGLMVAPNLGDGFGIVSWSVWDVEGHKLSSDIEIVAAVFTTLVALYKAEHPEGEVE